MPNTTMIPSGAFIDDGAGGNLWDYETDDIQLDYDAMLCTFGADDSDVQAYASILRHRRDL